MKKANPYISFLILPLIYLAIASPIISLGSKLIFGGINNSTISLGWFISLCINIILLNFLISKIIKHTSKTYTNIDVGHINYSVLLLSLFSLGMITHQLIIHNYSETAIVLLALIVYYVQVTKFKKALKAT